MWSLNLSLGNNLKDAGIQFFAGRMIDCYLAKERLKKNFFSFPI